VRRSRIAAAWAAGAAAVLGALVAGAPASAGGSAPGFVTMGPGVTIGATLVGGLTPAEATTLVRERFQRPLTIVAANRRVKLGPHDLGATTRLGDAVRRAASYRADVAVPLEVEVRRARIERFAARLAKELNRAPVDARFFLRGLTPFATKDKPGRALREEALVRDIVRALRTNSREPVVAEFRELKPAVTRDSFGKTIVIRRESKLLQLFEGLKLKRQFRVATGQSSFPTPIGAFEITTLWRNPWWYPPPSDWARDQQPVPPGPGNPLGTRWMGLSAPYIGIHGTPDSSSIGYSASHGCIRMLVPEAEWLFDRVEIGTRVFIVAA
jgi:lipoprotein-anchoring transpeptidase ErfK/SrfK